MNLGKKKSTISPAKFAIKKIHKGVCMKLDAAVKIRPKLNSRRWPWDCEGIFFAHQHTYSYVASTAQALLLDSACSPPHQAVAPFADVLSFRYLLTHHRKLRPASGCRAAQHNLLLLSCFWCLHLQAHLIAKRQYQTIDCKPTIYKDLQNCYGKFTDTSTKLTCLPPPKRW